VVPGRQRIVTANEDKTARVWNAATGQLLGRLEGHTKRLHSAAWSQDGQLIVTASEDKKARVWNAAAEQLLAKLDRSLALRGRSRLSDQLGGVTRGAARTEKTDRPCEG